jgi:hypothetical protein
MMEAEPSFLGFTHRVRKDGAVEILHHGRPDFLAEAPDSTSADAQQLMARLTGNFKRGNERLAAGHPRNRD